MLLQESGGKSGGEIQEDKVWGKSLRKKRGKPQAVVSPYFFYDLDVELETKLQLFPFTTMEASYQYYKKCTPAEASHHISKLSVQPVQ